MRSNSVAVARRFAVAGAVVVASACEPPAAPPEARGPGAVFVHASVQSIELAYFQYGVAIDKGTPRTASAPSPLDFVATGLSQGTHTVSVTGVAPACSGAGDRDVTLRGDDTANVIIAISCPRTSGDISIVVTTTGQDLDPDGYIVLVDGNALTYTPPNGSGMARLITAGTHSVSLTNVASNCSAGGAKSVTVAAGATTTVTFTVTCTAVAAVRFVASATGPDRDPDGYALQLGTLAATQISATTTTIMRVNPGAISYSLGDVQPNCTVAEALTGTLNIVAGDTAVVNLTSTCTAIPMGDAGTTATDPAFDTITTTYKGPTTPHDIRGLTAWYATGWMTLVVRFAKPVTSSATGSAQALYGGIDLDTDESTLTGVEPLSNYYGGSATMGSDYFLAFSVSDSVSARMYSSTTGVSVGKVRVKYEGDSVIVHIPLNKLKGDDGRMTFATVIGTQDRPTDVMPNQGALALRPPASAIMASVVEHGPAYAGAREAPSRKSLEAARWW